MRKERGSKTVECKRRRGDHLRRLATLGKTLTSRARNLRKLRDHNVYWSGVTSGYSRRPTRKRRTSTGRRRR